MQNRVFFPQATLDLWLSDGTVDLRDDELTIVAEGRRYQLTEAVRIIAEVTGADDIHDLVGRVKSKDLLLQAKGAEILESSMIVGDNAYDVIPGWLGLPTSTFEDYVASPHRAEARASGKSAFPAKEPTTDEDLLATYLSKAL
jgi:hypothetical protein